MALHVVEVRATVELGLSYSEVQVLASGMQVRDGGYSRGVAEGFREFQELAPDHTIPENGDEPNIYS